MKRILFFAAPLIFITFCLFYFINLPAILLKNGTDKDYKLMIYDYEDHPISNFFILHKDQEIEIGRIWNLYNGKPFHVRVWDAKENDPKILQSTPGASSLYRIDWSPTMPELSTSADPRIIDRWILQFEESPTRRWMLIHAPETRK